jgi:hypothetical protein
VAERGRFRIMRDRNQHLPGYRWLLFQRDPSAEETMWDLLWTASTQRECLVWLVNQWRRVTGEHVCGGTSGDPFACGRCEVIVARWGGSRWEPAPKTLPSYAWMVAMVADSLPTPASIQRELAPPGTVTA